MIKKSIRHFLSHSIYWGGILGFLTGIPYLVFWWPYGPFGILINVGIGIILGVINGALFSFLLEKFVKRDSYRLITLSASFATFLVSQIAYFISFIPYGGSRGGSFVVATFPSIINAIIAGFAVQRAAKFYKSGEAKRPL